MRKNSNQLRKKIQNYSYGLNDHLDLHHKGTSFKGINELTQQKVSIKVIDLRSKQNDSTKQHLTTQIQILKKLKHRNIIDCYDIYSTINNCYIITQFCQQGDLQNRIISKGCIKQDQATHIFKDIFSGWFYLVQQKYIHGNLQPSVLLIKNKIIKISGFNHSRKVNKEKEYREEIKFCQYYSPECLKDGVTNYKSDIWSLGMILYVLIHGNLPWEFSNTVELLQKVGKPYLINNDLSQELKQFIKRTLTVKQTRISLEQLTTLPFIKKLNPTTFSPQRYIPTILESPSSPQPFSPHIPHLPPIQKRKQSTNRTQKHLTSQLNWMRFLFRLIQRIINYPQQFNTLALKFIMIRQLSIQYQQLKKTLEKGQNPFGFIHWNDFYQDKDKIKKYKEILFKYQSRYEKSKGNYKKILQKISVNNNLSYLSSLLNQNFLLSEYNCFTAIKISIQQINKLWSRIIKQYPCKKYEKQFPFRYKSQLLLLDFLISYFQLNCLLIDDFYKLENFDKNSKLEYILDYQPHQLDASYLEIFQDKIKQLGLLNTLEMEEIK